MGSKSSEFYTKGTIRQLSLKRGKCGVLLSPSSAYSRVCGEEKCIELYQEGQETKFSKIKHREEKREFSVDESIPLELLVQLRRNGSEIKFFVKKDTIVGIQF